MTRYRGPQPQLAKRSLTNGDRLPDHSTPREIHDRDTGPITIPPPMNSSADALRDTVAYMAEKFTAESEKNYATRESIREIRSMSDSIKDMSRDIRAASIAAAEAAKTSLARDDAQDDMLKMILRETSSNKTDIVAIKVENTSIQARVSMLEHVALVENAESAGAQKLIVRQKNIAKIVWSVAGFLFAATSYIVGKLLK